MPYQRYATLVSTTNATPTVVFSTPVEEGSSARLDVDFQVINEALSNSSTGTISALFYRQTGGNVTRGTGNGGLLSARLTVDTTFLINAPKIELVANTSTQTADVRITGQSGTTLNWKFTPNVRRD